MPRLFGRAPERTLLRGALALALAGGCAPAGDPAPAPSLPVVGPGSPRPYAYALLDSARVDVDGDGEAERVELSATVEVDPRGRPLWEDGHHWLVLVRDGAAGYPLVEQFVPWGAAAFWILEPDPAAAPVVLVETRSRLADQVGISVRAFRFDRERGGFAVLGAVEAGGAVLHGAPERLPVLLPDSASDG